MSEMPLNVREEMETIAHWLGYQNEDLSFGLKSIADAVKLFDKWTSDPTLPEFCDEDRDDSGRRLAPIRRKILGYDPLSRV